MTGKYVGLLALLIFQGYLVLAQPAPPTYNVLTRILMVESQHGRGSISAIDVDNREYWITAKHVLTGAEHPPYGAIPAKTVSLQLLNPGGEGQQWIPVTFSVIDPGPDIDIVVLAPPQPLLTNPLPSVAADSTGMLLGGDCEFLGFPYGGGWRARFDNGQSFWMPFVNHCTVSAMSEDGKQIYVLDGINNKGFSGGPVIFRTGPDQRIMAVVSGYIIEPTAVTSSGLDKSGRKSPNKTTLATQRKQTVDVNSGFIISYDIS